MRSHNLMLDRRFDSGKNGLAAFIRLSMLFATETRTNGISPT
jgi:hypothetical protein